MSETRAQRHVHPSILLVILCTAAFMSTLDMFIVNVGLRSIGTDVHDTSLADLSWVLNAYAIVFSALLVPAGRLGDRYGNKRAFLTGLALFTLGSLGCALWSDLWLIVGLRCLQAVGAAALIPTSLGLILTAMPAQRRAHSVRIWAVTGSLGAAAGPAIGGLLVQASWRWIFLLNVPIGGAALVAAALLVPSLRHGTDTRIPDLIGGVLLMAAVASLALALVQGPGWGWTSGRTLAAFVIAVTATVAFVARSSRAVSPVIDLGLFRNPVFTWANIAMVLLSISFGTQLLGLVFWLQEGWGWSAVRTGLGIAPGPVMVSLTGLGLRRWTAKLPVNVAAAIGAMLMGGGGVLIGDSLTAHPHYASEILPGWLIIGTGVGLAIPTIIGAASSGLAAHQTSTGSAVVQMGRQIGSVLGVALLVVVIGSSTITVDKLHQFVHAWWWAGLFALLGLLSVLAMRPRRPVSVVAPSPEPAAVL
ncbi:MAG: MFS transporter [Actinomycetota bacterium]|nr:MFS transporter [Actinomycetota bacterium]